MDSCQRLLKKPEVYSNDGPPLQVLQVIARCALQGGVSAGPSAMTRGVKKISNSLLRCA
jgi:hypothetical protein